MEIDWNKIEENLANEKKLTWLDYDYKGDGENSKYIMEPIDYKEVIEWFKNQIEKQKQQQ